MYIVYYGNKISSMQSLIHRPSLHQTKKNFVSIEKLTMCRLQFLLDRSHANNGMT